MTEILDNARRGLEELGASVFDRELVDLIARHSAEENEILSSYENAADRSPDEATRYLIRLIMDDERRHHRLLAEMANAVGWQDPHLSPEPAVPPLPVSAHGDPALKARTRELLAFERADRTELRALRRRLRPFGDTTLWTLLVDLMIADTDKHIRILRFIDAHIAQSDRRR